MKVLLTGFSGLLGTAISKELLRRGHSVRALLHGAAIRRCDLDRRVEVFWGGLADVHAFDQLTCGVDAVIHCAWDPRAENGKTVEQLNREATCGLAEAANRAGVRTFVHISSIAVYGMDRTLYGKVLDETQPLAGDLDALNAYPRGKILIEQQLDVLRESMEMNIVIVRPGLLFSDTKPPTRKYLSRKKSGFGVVFGTGRNHLPYVHVADVSNLVVTMIEQPVPHSVYNAVAEEKLGTAQFLKQWGKATGKRITVLRLPPSIFRLMNWAAQRLKRALGRQAAKPDVAYQIRSGTRHIYYHAAEAGRDFGWRATGTQAVASGRLQSVA